MKLLSTYRYHCYICKYAISVLFVCLAILVQPATSKAQMSSQDRIKNLEQSIKIQKNDSAKIFDLIELSRLIHKHSHHSREEYALAKEAVDLSQKFKDAYIRSRALDNLGLIYRYHRHYKEALSYHQKAYELIKDSTGELLSKMIVTNNAGLAARYDEQYDLAVFYYLISLKLAEKENVLRNIAISSNGLGNSLSEIEGREEEALQYFLKGLKAERLRNDSLGMAMDLLSISAYYTKKGQFYNAFTHLEELKTINDNRNDSFGIALTHEAYGDAYSKEGKNIDSAINSYQQALKIYETRNDYQNIASVLNKLGDNEITIGEKNKAMKYYKESFELASNTNLKSLIMSNAYSMAKLLQEDGNYKTSLDYYMLGKKYEDSIAIYDQEVKIAALTNKYELDKKQDKISFLEDEQELKQKLIATQKDSIRIQKIYLYFALLGLTTIAVLGISHYRSSKTKRIMLQHIQEKEKQLLKAEYQKSLAEAEMIISRMQVNPHFIFNCLSAIHLLIQKNENQKASKYLISFSRFIRNVLELPKHEPISLKEEMKIIEDYLKLEEKRFNNDFTYKLHSSNPNKNSEVKIPPLLLQPFVENAIWHGLLPSRKPDKKLVVDINFKEDNVLIRIEDNGVGRKIVKNGHKASFRGKKSLGMKITEERIAQFNKKYGCKIAFTISDKENESGTVVLITLNRVNKALSA